MRRKTVIGARLLGQRGIELNINTQHFEILFTCFWLCWVYAAAGGLSPGAASRAYALVAVQGLLTVLASLVTEPGSQHVGSSSRNSWAPEHRLTSSGTQASLLCDLKSSRSRNRTCASRISRWLLYHVATRETPTCSFFIIHPEYRDPGDG